MGRAELIKLIEEVNGVSTGKAAAAFTTYRNIKLDGFEVVRDYMARSTFLVHLRYLRAVGISNADLGAVRRKKVHDSP
jgi:II/X family phage/plasmid replication protein